MDSPTAVSTAATVGSQVTQVMDKIPETLKNVLDVLSQKLGETGEALLKILVKQQIVYGAQGLLTALLLGIVLAIYWGKVYPKVMNHIQDGDGRIILTVISSVATGVLVIAILVNGIQSVGYFINPQYYAIKDLMKMAHGG